MEELLIVTLENNNYIVIDEIKNLENKYIYLCSTKDKNDFAIRKEIIEDGKIYLQSLKDEVEFNLAIYLLKEKNA